MTVVSIGRSGSGNTTVTSSASAHTKGTWVELTSSLSIDANWIIVQFTGTGVGNVGLLDIGTGAAASETVVIPDLIIPNSRAADRFFVNLWIPMAFSSGTRIAARCQDDVGSGTTTVGAVLGTEGFTQNVTSVTALGITTASTTAISVDPGAVADTKGSYAEVIASTSAEYDAFIICATHDNTTAADAHELVDLATGAAASEVVQIPDFAYGTYSSPDQITQPYTGIIQHTVASGTRIALRAQSSITDATDRVLDNCAVYGLELSAASSGGGLKLAGTGGLAG